MVELATNQRGRSTGQWERMLALLLGKGPREPRVPGSFCRIWGKSREPKEEPGHQECRGALGRTTDQLLQKDFSMGITCVDTPVHPGSVSVLGQGIGFSFSLT